MNETTFPTRPIPRGRPLKTWHHRLPIQDVIEDTHFCMLHAMQRLLLLVLMGCADHHGRGRARPSTLRVMAFDGLLVTEDDVARWLQEMTRIMRGSRYELVLYEVDGQQYYAFPRWFEFVDAEFVPRASKYPPPPTSTPADEPGADQYLPDEPV